MTIRFGNYRAHAAYTPSAYTPSASIPSAATPSATTPSARSVHVVAHVAALI